MEPRNQHGEDADEHKHPSALFYVLIGFILTVITLLEVGIFYIEALSGAIVPLLLTLSTVKFILVVMFYMHLKMDSRVFTTVFMAPLALAVFLVFSLVMLFKVIPTLG